MRSFLKALIANVDEKHFWFIIITLLYLSVYFSIVKFTYKLDAERVLRSDEVVCNGHHLPVKAARRSDQRHVFLKYIVSMVILGNTLFQIISVDI